MENRGRDPSRISSLQDLVANLPDPKTDSASAARHLQQMGRAVDRVKVEPYPMSEADQFKVSEPSVQPYKAVPAWVSALSTYPTLTIREASCVLAGVDPLRHGEYSEQEEASIRMWKVALNRAHGAGLLTECDEGIISRVDFDEWCSLNGLSLLLNPLPQVVKEKLGQFSAKVVKSAEAVSVDESDYLRLVDENKALKASLEESRNKLKELSTDNSSSIMKIIYALAIAKPYCYEHAAKRNEATSAISSATYAAGFGVTDETVRKHLRAAHLRLFGASSASSD